jgi:WD40 repeat protein
MSWLAQLPLVKLLTRFLPEPGTVLWRLESEKSVLSIRGTELTLAYAFSPDSRLLVVGYRDGSAQLWSLEQGQELFHWTLYPEPLEYLVLAFTPDGESLASSDGASAIRFLHLAPLRRHLADLGLDW